MASWCQPCTPGTRSLGFGARARTEAPSAPRSRDAPSDHTTDLDVRDGRVKLGNGRPRASAVCRGFPPRTIRTFSHLGSAPPWLQIPAFLAALARGSGCGKFISEFVFDVPEVQRPASWASFGPSWIQGRGPGFRVWERGIFAKVGGKFFPDRAFGGGVPVYMRVRSHRR